MCVQQEEVALMVDMLIMNECDGGSHKDFHNVCTLVSYEKALKKHP